MEKKRNQTGRVLRIERSSMHDGDGLRSVVFLKGCPLSCLWCSTPESQHSGYEIGFRAGQCTGCGRCAAACPASLCAMQNSASSALRVKKHARTMPGSDTEWIWMRIRW